MRTVARTFASSVVCSMPLGSAGTARGSTEHTSRWSCSAWWMESGPLQRKALVVVVVVALGKADHRWRLLLKRGKCHRRRRDCDTEGKSPPVRVSAHIVLLI